MSLLHDNQDEEILTSFLVMMRKSRQYFALHLKELGSPTGLQLGKKIFAGETPGIFVMRNPLGIGGLGWTMIIIVLQITKKILCI